MKLRGSGFAWLGATALLVGLPPTVQARQTPDEVVVSSYELLTDECDAACCDVVAGLHSQNFLTTIHRARIASLEAGYEPDPTDPGRVYPNPADIAAMTPRTSFAASLCETIRELPAAYRFTQVEILDKREIAPDQIEFVLNLTGLEAAPDMKEERFVRVVLEDGQWRIDL